MGYEQRLTSAVQPIGAEADSVIADRDATIVKLTAEKGAAVQHAIELEAEITRLQGVIADLEAGQTPPPDPEPTPDPTPTPTPKTMLVGSSLYRAGGETQEAGYARRCKEWGVGDLEMVRYFWSGMPSGWPQFGTAQTVASFKPTSMQDLAAGKLNAVLTSWLDGLAKLSLGYPLRVAVWHEREDDIENKAFTFEIARSADAQMNTLIDAANKKNGTKITFGLVLMGWTLDSRSGRDLKNYLPTDFKYDWMGWDAYSGNSVSLDLPNFDYTQSLFKRCYDATKAHNPNANAFICETGTSNKTPKPSDPTKVAAWADAYDTKQAQWLTGAVKVAADLGFKGFMYWDSVTAVEKDGSVKPENDYRIQKPKAAAAMGKAIKA